MFLAEPLILIDVIAVILLVIKRKKVLEKFKKLTIFDKIFISGFLLLSLFTTFLIVLFMLRIPFNPLSLLPPVVLSFFNPLTSLLFLGFATFKWFFPEYKKTTPKIKTEKFQERALTTLLKSNKVLGSGTQTDPYVIENSKIFPEVDVIRIKKSSAHLLFRNHDLKSIKIKSSSNITIENCNYSFLQLYNCNEVKITDCTFNLLELNKSVKIFIQNSKISLLKMFNSFLNEFENCSIKRIEKHHSPDNIFKLKEQLEDKDRKSNVFQNNIPSILILFLVSLILGDILFFSLMTNTANLYTILLVPIILTFILIFLVMALVEAINLQQKLKKFYEGSVNLRFNGGKLVLGCVLIISGLVLINGFFFVLYTNPLLWIEIEIISFNTLVVITLVSGFITIGTNIMLRNISSFSERFVRTKNPIYPFFLLYNIFYAFFLIFLYIFAFLFSLFNAFLIITQFVLTCILINLVISVLTRLRMSKLTQSPYATRIIYSVALVGSGGFTYPLIDFLLPFYVSYFGLLNFPQEAFFYITTISASGVLALIGILSFPKTGKLLAAVQYSKKEKYAKSIKNFQTALKDEPNNEDGLYNLGVAYYKNEEYTKSVDALKKVLAINQNSIKTLLMLGHASAQVGDFETAINACEKAIHIFKNPVVSVATKLSDIIKQSISQPIKEEFAWYSLSNVYGIKEDYNKLLETANKALELNPKFKEAWVALAHGYNKLNETDKAIETCNRALELDSNFAFAWNQLGKAYQLKGDLKLGIQMLEKAVELSPKEHRIRLNLAKVYLDKKDYKRALETINISLGLKPNYKDAIEAKEQIVAIIDKIANSST